MKLAVFDLDHTLLPIDSGDAWSHWLVRKAGLDEEKIGAQIEAYAQAYRTGHFVPLSFIRFQFGLLAAQKRQDLEAWRASFIDEVIRPAVRPEALQLVAQRRLAGYEVVLATGTHRFVTAPIAALFGIQHLIAATPEIGSDGEFTGELVGLDSYGEGKLALIKNWMANHAPSGGFEAFEGWSDSINDKPL